MEAVVDHITLVELDAELEEENEAVEGTLGLVNGALDELRETVDSGYGCICEELETELDTLLEELVNVVESELGALCVELGVMVDELEEVVESEYGSICVEMEDAVEPDGVLMVDCVDEADDMDGLEDVVQLDDELDDLLDEVVEVVESG